MAKKLKKDQRYAIADNTLSSFWCGKDDWNWMDFTRHINEVEDQYLFSTEAKALDAINAEEDLHGCVPIRVCDVNIKPKSLYNMSRYGSGKPLELKLGVKNEICDNCGINILANEPYLVHTGDTRGICLHCVMEQLCNVDHLYSKTDPRYKKEWLKHGMEGLGEKCSDFI